MKKKYKKIIYIASKIGKRPVKVSFYEKKTGKRVDIKAYETYIKSINPPSLRDKSRGNN